MQDRDWIFEDLNRELVNRFPFAVATSYDQFVDRILSAVQQVLNSPVGQEELIGPLRQHAIESNMSEEEWQARKVNIMSVLFFVFLDEVPMLKHEMALHLYRELRKEN